MNLKTNGSINKYNVKLVCITYIHIHQLQEYAPNKYKVKGYKQKIVLITLIHVCQLQE